MSISIPGDAQLAYTTVVKGDPKVEWAIFSLASAGSELKLQSTGSGLDDLQEEFMDGRIQYAFARVEDPNTNLERFIQINWCGDGVAAFQKGLFNTYSPQISGFLKATHIVLQARNEDDVTPDHIYKRMQESSGSKYGAGNASSASPAVANKPAPAFTSAPKPYVPSSSSASSFNKPTPGPSYNRPTGAFDKPTPSFNKPTTSFNKPTPAPAAEAPPAPPPREPSPPPPAPAAAPAPTPATSKPAEDDRIAPVGTAYEPVKLAAPKKLVNRWGQGAFNNNDDEDKPDEKPKAGGFSAARSAFMGGAASNNAPSSVSSGPTPGKKLTWSERQAEAKKQREAEEQAATEAMGKVSISANNTGTKSFGYGASTPSAPPLAPAAPAPPAEEQEEEEDIPPPPPPPPAPLPPRVPEPEVESKAENEDDWDDAPPAPPPPPMASRPAVPVVAAVEEDEDEAPPPPPPPPPMPNFDSEPPAPAAPAAPRMPARAPSQAQVKNPAGGPKAKAMYDYDVSEFNEISFKEDDIIEGIEQTDPDWWTGVDPRTGNKGLFPSNYVEMVGDDAQEQEEEEDVPPPPPPPPAPPAAGGMGMGGAAAKGKTAIAQYDYEATEDNEISFAEGDEIIQIEETDPDWWTGTNAKTGKQGLFPANYVEAS
ncbi:hypothetical protein FFLO_06223 [Filobasidium floriforme]|uniref:Actin binding protein n=1 Tax=Filobasidium floriforme TaxID=5210 RepID=A0A8K0JFS9_9TREE|nr:hypothetical protein FFLO_06223 [Filobasidium floriforme]